MQNMELSPPPYTFQDTMSTATTTTVAVVTEEPTLAQVMASLESTHDKLLQLERRLVKVENSPRLIGCCQCLQSIADGIGMCIYMTFGFACRCCYHACCGCRHNSNTSLFSNGCCDCFVCGCSDESDRTIEICMCVETSCDSCTAGVCCIQSN